MLTVALDINKYPSTKFQKGTHLDMAINATHERVDAPSHPWLQLLCNEGLFEGSVIHGGSRVNRALRILPCKYRCFISLIANPKRLGIRDVQRLAFHNCGDNNAIINLGDVLQMDTA